MASKPTRFTKIGRMELIHNRVITFMQHDIDTLESETSNPDYILNSYIPTVEQRLKSNWYQKHAEEFVRGLENLEFVAPGLIDEIQAAENPEWPVYRERLNDAKLEMARHLPHTFVWSLTPSDYCGRCKHTRDHICHDAKLVQKNTGRKMRGEELIRCRGILWYPTTNEQWMRKPSDYAVCP